MPVKKGEGCIRDVMREWKAGALRSGKDGPVVTDREQATAIALSMCGGARSKSAKSYEEAAARVLEEARDFAEDCGCKDKKGTKEYDECNCGCKRCKKRVPMAIGYPTPTFSEDEVVGMVRNRLKVIHGRVSEIERVIEGAMMSEGEVEIEQWMIDKITLAADYLSAVADNATYGDGVEVEEEDGYAEKKLKGSYAKGLTEREQAIAKREAKETQEKAKQGKGAKEVYEDWESDKKYKSRQEKQGKSMPKSKATEAYERMYGKKDSEDMGESGTESALQKKSKESGIPYGILKQVHARGMAAWQTGHRPGVPPQQWAMGRVNSFITGSGGARKADADLWKKAS